MGPEEKQIKYATYVRDNITTLTTSLNIIYTATAPPSAFADPSPLAVPNAIPPLTPTNNARGGSVRSILKDKQTPGTGQSVRFFSRDAYRVITPDTSAAVSDGSTE